MNQKTESNVHDSPAHESEFQPGFVQGLLIFTVATLILVFSFERYVPLQPFSLRSSFILYPWVVAGGYTIEQGLNLFSGKSVQPLSFEQQAMLFGGLWLVAVLGPTLFLLGWRQRRIERATGTVSGKLRISTITYLLGGIVTLTVALPALPAAIIQRVVAQQMYDAQAIASNRDAIINELNWIALHAVQYRILPKELGGGAGSYAGFTMPTHMATTENASYSITDLTADKIGFVATSRIYPASTVSVTFGSDRQPIPTSWKYSGEFQ